MPNAQVVASWTEPGFACLAVRVNEGETDDAGKPVAREYVGRVPIDDTWPALSAAQRKAALVAAVKAERDRSRALAAPATTDLGLSGAVSL